MLNILYLYDSTQTFTNTVHEHISSFAKYSTHRSFFCHQDLATKFTVDLSRFDAVCIHYSIRLPYDQISPSTSKALAAFKGLKALFIQDEYDYPSKTWNWIKLLGLHLVFTVVPENGIERIYPASEFPNTKFINVLTGYVPDGLGVNQAVVPPSQRSLIVGYRGRHLPIRYGRLGMEKVGIGQIVKSYCDSHAIENNIAWDEASRIYGPNWYKFLVSCRSMLGSESGSNVFDWDGTLAARIAKYREENHAVTDDELYAKFVADQEIHGIMNQVSPRIFEAIAAKTVLVLFEGDYSGVVKAGEDFIAVKKDGSNLDEVLCLLHDGAYVDAMVERAFQNVIASGKYSYRSFVRFVDGAIEQSFKTLERRGDQSSPPETDPVLSITTMPLRAKPPQLPSDTLVHTVIGSEGKVDLAKRFLVYVWFRLPEKVRSLLKPGLKRLVGRL